MSIPLGLLLPNVDDLLSLEVEEVAGVLLSHLNSYDSQSGSSVVQQDRISSDNFFNTLHAHPEYPRRQRLAEL